MLILSDTLDSLKYLDNVVHESLRLETPIPLTVRIAQEDCVVPLGKPVMGRDGTMIDSLVLTKGTKINIREYIPHCHIQN